MEGLSLLEAEFDESPEELPNLGEDNVFLRFNKKSYFDAYYFDA